ncbi:MAG: monovalent cation/H(+) antiporter subunit G [Anaerolineales bacterium]
MEIFVILWKIIAILLLLLSIIFSALGMLGVMRMPDVYTRLHATGKISAFGAVMILGAAVVILPDLTIFKGFVIIIFLLLASPVVAHTISSAAYKTGLPMKQSLRDDLAKVLPRGSGKDV